MKKGISKFIIYTKSCFCIIWTPIVAQNTESLHKLWMVHSRMLVQYNNREMVLRWFLYLLSSFTLYSRAVGRYKNPEGASGHNLPPPILIEIGFTNHGMSARWQFIFITQVRQNEEISPRAFFNILTEPLVLHKQIIPYTKALNLSF